MKIEKIKNYAQIPGAHAIAKGGCFCAALLCTNAAQAQQRPPQSVPQNAARSAPLALPYGVDQLIADDAHSTLLAIASPDENGEREVFEITVRHIYPGAIARLFGGLVILTEALAGPSNFATPFGDAPFGAMTIGSRLGRGQNASQTNDLPAGIEEIVNIPSGGILWPGIAR